MIMRMPLACTYIVATGDRNNVTGWGTCFNIEFEGSQYIVTAKHVYDQIGTDHSITIVYNNRRKHPLAVSLVGCSDESDLAVVAPKKKFNQCLQVSPEVEFWPGQEVYAYGYPGAALRDPSLSSREIPHAFVKKAIVSMWIQGQDLLLLDGYLNQGFSGGPIIFAQSAIMEPRPKVVAVVSGGQLEESQIAYGNSRTSFATLTNAGIVRAYRIEQAINIIRKAENEGRLPK